MQQMPSFKNPQKDQEWPIALAACDAFRRHTLQFLGAPDNGSNQPLMAPDFVFTDVKSGDHWNVEVKRLVSRHVRRQYAFACRHVSEKLEGIMPGLYTCEMRLDSLDPTAQLSRPDLEAVVDVIRRAVQDGTLPDHSHPLPGYRLSRIDSGWSHVEPWLWDYTLEPGSSREENAFQLLSAEFHRHLDNALEKFDSFPADRNILIFDTRGTLLDRDLHMLGPYADGPGLLSQWMSQATVHWDALDTVMVDPHVSNWVDGTDRAILMGTIYSADEPYTPIGTLVRLWPGGCPDFVGLRLGLKSLMESSECSCS